MITLPTPTRINERISLWFGNQHELYLNRSLVHYVGNVSITFTARPTTEDILVWTQLMDIQLLQPRMDGWLMERGDSMLFDLRTKSGSCIHRVELLVLQTLLFTLPEEWLNPVNPITYRLLLGCDITYRYADLLIVD